MKTRLIRIGNFCGVRLPKRLIAEAGLGEKVELRVQEGAIVIARSALPRSGWAEAARHLRQRDEDTLLDPLTPTRFDEKEWEW
jgi:antitoxin MazE